MSTNQANILQGSMPLLTPSRAVRRGFIEFVSMALRVRAERRALLALTDRDLKDIGLSRSEVYREGSRRLFDVPYRSVPGPFKHR